MGTRQRLLIFSVTTVAVLILAAASGYAVLWWYQRGPGLEREADRLMEAGHLGAASVVADVGAGKGRLAVRMARRVSRVVATEIDDGMLDQIRARAASERAANVNVIRAGEHDTGLTPACCDLITMRRVYHHVTDKPATLASLKVALRMPGGRLVVIDFLTPRWWPWRHGVDAPTVEREVTAAGFTLERTVEHWTPLDFGLVFRPRGAN
jgi:ubiquinone/menaquinone biosynthesis C-methylase UbiE